jgi:hypothetical protein
MGGHRETHATMTNNERPKPKVQKWTVNFDEATLVALKEINRAGHARTRQLTEWVREAAESVAVPDGVRVLDQGDLEEAYRRLSMGDTRFLSDLPASPGSREGLGSEQEKVVDSSDSPDSGSWSRGEYLAALALLIAVLQLLASLAGPKPMSAQDVTRAIEQALKHADEQKAETPPHAKAEPRTSGKCDR